jgi:hypothetical protein
VNTQLWIWVIVLAAVVLDFYFIWVWRRYKRLRKAQIEKEFARGGLWRQLIRSMFPDKMQKWASMFWRRQSNRRVLQVLFELLLIGLWAAWVGREYLNFDPTVIPAGNEFSSAIQTHHLWTRFQDCGWCALWNGSIRGGYPALADVHGSMLHPLVVITTLIWGVVNGAKLTLVLSFWVAGVAQWWLARILRLGWLPRLWSAGIAVVGGHIAGRMELGALGVVLSTAMTSLVFAGILAVAIKGNRRSAIILGVLIASAILSGQGYIQVGLVGIAPGMLFLLIDDQWSLRAIWKKYALALLLGVLLAAIFLVPFLHFSPNFFKNMDADFKAAQSLAYMPLNLVIDDWDYYKSEILGKLPFPHLNTLFIGWIPVLLAIVGLSQGKKEDHPILWFLGFGIVLQFLIGSAVLLKSLVRILPGVAGVRHPSQITGLAIPLILLLSAYGLERLLHFSWPDLILRQPSVDSKFQLKISLSWILILPLIFSLRQGHEFSKLWIFSVDQRKDIPELLAALQTDSLEWVNPPFGEHAYIEPAVAHGLKISPGYMTFWWKDRPFPTPVIEANREGPPEGDVEKIAELNGILIYARDDQPYAAVEMGGSHEPCSAEGVGGALSVDCNLPASGRLQLKENTWTGWKAWRDGKPVPLEGEQWLEVDAPAGQHHYEFRYQPWDVPVGLGISVLGVILSIRLWFRPSEEKQDTPQEEHLHEEQELTKGAE